jgi:hypothetical protein
LLAKVNGVEEPPLATVTIAGVAAGTEPDVALVLVKVRAIVARFETSGCVVAVTVNVVEPTTRPDVALTMLVPAPTPVAKPAEEMVAVPVVPDAQVTEDVMSTVVLSV